MLAFIAETPTHSAFGDLSGKVRIENRCIDLFAVTFPDSLNLLQLDQASCHVATTLVWPDNVIPIFQPAHSPELNPPIATVVRPEKAFQRSEL